MLWEKEKMLATSMKKEKMLVTMLSNSTLSRREIIILASFNVIYKYFEFGQNQHFVGKELRIPK